VDRARDRAPGGAMGSAPDAAARASSVVLPAITRDRARALLPPRRARPPGS
jgi:hypothetical protein